MLRSLLIGATLALSLGGLPSGPALAQSAPAAAPEDLAGATSELFAALGMDQLLPIMRQEGIDYGLTLEADMFPGRGGDEWRKVVEQIYTQERMTRIVMDRFAVEMAGSRPWPLLEFFTSDIGRQIITLEISAREAMLDDAVEQMSRDSYARMRERGATKLEMIDAFVAANGLVETNVVGALNSNLAFYQGLVAGGAFTFEITEEQMLTDVWEQEGEIREETTTWVYSYLSMAYQPLEDADLAAYVALSETPEGKALNRALFAAFDELFITLSRDLGVGAAQFMAGEDI